MENKLQNMYNVSLKLIFFIRAVLLLTMATFPAPTAVPTETAFIRHPTKEDILAKLHNIGVAVIPLNEISKDDRNHALNATSFYHNANHVFDEAHQVKEITLKEKLHPQTIIPRKAPDAAQGWIHQYMTPLHTLVQENPTFRQCMDYTHDNALKFKPNRLRLGSKKFKNNDKSLHFDGHPFETKGAFVKEPLIATIIAVTGKRRFVWWDLNGKDLTPIYYHWVTKGSKAFTLIDPVFMNATYPGCRRLIDVDCSKNIHLIIFNECIPHEIANSPSISLFLSPVKEFDKTKITKKMVTSYHSPHFIGLTKHQSDLVGICYQMPGFEWPSHKKAYPFCHIRPYSHYKTRIKPQYLKNNKIQMDLIGGTIDQHSPAYQQKLSNRGIKLPKFLFEANTPHFVNDIASFSDTILRDYGFIL